MNQEVSRGLVFATGGPERVIRDMKVTYSLLVEVCRLACGIDEVAVDARLIYSVELTLVSIEIRLAQRPGLRER